jgi:hypothetical protein
MKYFSPVRAVFLFVFITLITGCGIQLKETYIINPDLSGKCIVDAKMLVDTTSVDARLALKDSLYGIEPSFPNCHKMKFNRRDAMAFALKFIKVRGVEVWCNIHYGMSKKRDMIYFSGTAYFRDITHIHLSAFDSLLNVTKNMSGVVMELNSKPIGPSPKMLSDDELDKRAKDYKKNAFYIRPVLADLLNPSEETVIYEFPNDIVSSSIYGQQGDRAAELTITGNDVLKYADSVVKSVDLEKEHYKVTGGTNKGAIQDLFNKLVFGNSDPMQIIFKKGGKDAFDYNAEVQSSMVYFGDFMSHSGLEKFDSTQMLKEERADMKAPEENGVLIVSKSDSETHKPYFTSLTASQSGDTLFFSGELAADIKAMAQGKVHIMKVIAGTDIDITDSLQAKTKLTAELSSEKGDNSDKASKRKVKFYLVVHFPKSCKEISIQGRVSTMIADKPGPTLAIKMKQIEIASAKKK